MLAPQRCDGSLPCKNWRTSEGGAAHGGPHALAALELGPIETQPCFEPRCHSRQCCHDPRLEVVGGEPCLPGTNKIWLGAGTNRTPTSTGTSGEAMGVET